MGVHPGLGATFCSAGARRVTIASPDKQAMGRQAAALPETIRFGTLEMFSVLLKSMRNREDDSISGIVSSLGGPDIWKKGKKALALALVEGSSSRTRGADRQRLGDARPFQALQTPNSNMALIE